MRSNGNATPKAKTARREALAITCPVFAPTKIIPAKTGPMQGVQPAPKKKPTEDIPRNVFFSDILF